jgi:hypothetical protein
VWILLPGAFLCSVVSAQLAEDPPARVEVKTSIDSIRLVDPLRSAVYRADLIVVGTLADVKRRDMRVRSAHPESQSRRDAYFDTGGLSVEEVLWGELSADPVLVCFFSRTEAHTQDLRTNPPGAWGPQPPRYENGDRGIWILGPEHNYLGRRLPVGGTEAVVLVADPAIENARRFIEDRRKGLPLYESVE